METIAIIKNARPVMTKMRLDCTTRLRAGNVPLLRSMGGRLAVLNRCGLLCAVTLTVSLLVLNTALGQGSNPAIEQSRLFPRTAPPSPGNVTPNGIAIPDSEATVSDDDSFGAQQILKTEEKIPDFAISAGSSFYYTTNVALTREGTMPDGFWVADAAANWTPRLTKELQLRIGGGVSIFRYFDTGVLNFESLGAGAGLTWTPSFGWGLALVGRYDFTELLNQSGDEILQDHQFALALQKVVALGRAHALTVGIIGSLGISHPFEEQRNQAGFAIGYHLQLTRSLGADLGYRHSWYFYSDGDRTDLNQVLALGVQYNITPWASLNAIISGATNYSNQEVFKYDVFSAGGGVGVIIRF